jgi:drug/metabolite transporter (DMT)-like permease
LDRPGTPRLVILLVTGIMAVSCGSIFIRLAGAPSLAVSAYRVSWATLILAPFTFSGPAREWKGLSRREWVLLLVSGAALALHFALWIASLSYTSVASSVLLVDTTPFFIGLASQFFLGRPCRRSFWIGLAIAFLGCLIIFHGDWSHSQNAMKGNVLAVGGAIAVAVYMLAGARARQKLSLLAYVWPVYGTAALVLLLSCLATGTPLTGYSGKPHLFMFLLGLVPQSIGHTTYNWSLRWIPPALVALISLGEPIGASLLAWAVLNEPLTAATVAGGAVVLSGIYLATRE